MPARGNPQPHFAEYPPQTGESAKPGWHNNGEYSISDLGKLFSISRQKSAVPREEQSGIINTNPPYEAMDGLSIQRKLPTMPESESIDEPASQRQHNEDRMRCADAWIKHSEQDDTEDIERFMFLWVAFNAAYGNEAALRDFVNGEEG